MSQDLGINVAGECADGISYASVPACLEVAPKKQKPPERPAASSSNPGKPKLVARQPAREPIECEIPENTIVAVMKRWRASRHFGIGATSA